MPIEHVGDMYWFRQEIAGEHYDAAFIAVDGVADAYGDIEHRFISWQRIWNEPDTFRVFDEHDYWNDFHSDEDELVIERPTP